MYGECKRLFLLGKQPFALADVSEISFCHIIFHFLNTSEQDLVPNFKPG